MASPRIKLHIFWLLAIILVIAVLIALLSTIMVRKGRNHGRVAVINQQKIAIETASTPNEQYQGLSGRKAICAECGMLFDFSESDSKTFVMRNMEFPLDIIFIDKGVIKNIAANLEPEGNNPKNFYKSAGAADQVLEVNGGYCAKYDIKPGDKIWIR